MKIAFGTMLGRALRLRCVVCGRGRPFPGWLAVRERCEACNFPIAREPGYFLGSIYLNYGLVGALILGWIVLAAAVLDLDEAGQILVPIAFILVFPVFFLRYARGLWMALDLLFDPPRAEEFDQARED